MGVRQPCGVGAQGCGPGPFRRFLGGRGRWLVVVAPAAAAIEAADRFRERWKSSLWVVMLSADVTLRLTLIPPRTSFALSR